LLRYAFTDWRGWCLILAVTLLSSLFGLLGPWPMKVLVDHVLGGVPLPEPLSRLIPGAGAPRVLLVWVVLAGVAVFGINSLLEVFLTRAWIRVGQRLVYDVAADLFARAQRRSLIFHSRHPVGDLMSRITGDCWCVYKVVDTFLFMPLLALTTIAGMVIVMLQVDVALTLLAIAVAPFMVGATFLLGRPIRVAARARREIESLIHAHVQQTLLGIPVIQAFAQEEHEQRRFQKFAADGVLAQRRTALVGSFTGLASGLGVTLGTAMVLWLGAQHVVKETLSLGSLVVFLAYLGALQTHLKALTGLYGALQEFGASADRVVEILEAAPEVSERRDALPLPAVAGLVRLENVTCGYVPGQPVLHEVTLEVKPGQTVALVGATGAGKTTLVHLIPRFFDVWQGRVTVDGVDVRDLRLDDLRSQVGMAFQEPFLFPMTMAENISYGKRRASRDDIEVAARAANIHDFICRLPQGYDTPVGPRGLTLSGGERQRLSIARALLKNAPILILDEPTSALDAETERLFLQAVTRLMQGRTTLIIAHRLSTVRKADKIVVLQDGRIAEEGTHGELLERDGLYAQLCRIQSATPLPQPELQS
jgi:ATP-binding cassette subfamily B protein/subfamily B ATP-binding cassette protein MsbA